MWSHIVSCVRVGQWYRASDNGNVLKRHESMRNNDKTTLENVISLHVAKRLAAAIL